VGDARAQEAASEAPREHEPAPIAATPLPGAVPLAGVPAGPVGQALLSRLSHAAGNRSVGALLQRQGTRAATKWDDVEAKLSFSEFGWWAMGVFKNNNVKLELRTDGPPAGFLPDSNTCIVNVTMPDYEIACYFVHEMYHASQFHGGASPGATTMAEDPWVKQMETEEVEGTLKGFLHKLALERFGYLAPANDRPVGMNYFRSAYNHAYKKTIDAGGTAQEARQAAIANGRRMVRYLVHPNDGTRAVLGPNQFDSYEQYYHREWQREHRKAAQRPAK
jgi:hypothetical protein